MIPLKLFLCVPKNFNQFAFSSLNKLNLILINPVCINIRRLISNENNSSCSSTTVHNSLEVISSKENDPSEPTNIYDLSDYGSLPLPSYNFAAYADKSPLIQELIKLGVELYKIEKNPRVGEYLLSLNFDQHIKPYLEFLHVNGVFPDDFGKIITRNPLLFKESLDDLEVRINYLQSKKFDKKMISTIITNNPYWLSTSVTVIDERLGFLQQSFNLNGDQVRKIITDVPTLATVSKRKIMLNIFVLKEEMELDKYSLKKLILAAPSLLKKDSKQIISTFDYITTIMKVPKHLIVAQPAVLTYRKFTVNERHRFLEKLGRAQYNPLLPGYVSLVNVICTPNEEFCDKVAKTKMVIFNEFLKTL